MDEVAGREFAAEVFAESGDVESVMVLSEVPANKHSPKTTGRRLDRLEKRCRDLVAEGNAAEARRLIETAKWTGPRLMWWCDEPVSLAPILSHIYGILREQKKRDGYAVYSLNDRVALLMIWHDR